MVLDLKSSGLDFCVAKKIHDQLAIEVADPNTLRQSFLNKAFHGRPGLLNGGVSRDSILTVISKAWWISNGGVNIFKGNGKMDNVQVEVVDLPILELLLADWLDTVMVMEGVPQF